MNTSNNLIYNTGKQLSLTYNTLNLPTQIDNGVNGKMQFIYNTAGQKLRTALEGSNANLNKTTDYVSNYVYIDKKLSYILMPEGRILVTEPAEVPNGSTFDYEYHLKDHLGNTRATYIAGANGTSTLTQTTAYYPFGLPINALSSHLENNPYLYNGKELHNELDMDLLDYGARYYDAAIARWVSVDPMAENYYAWSPYNYVRGNPIIRFDPNGLTDYTFNKKTGEVTQVGDANDDPDRIVRTYKFGKRKGEVKYKKNGEAKVDIDGIAKGILHDGQNFKTDDQIINIGGDGQPSLGEVETFVTQMSEYVGVEVAGAYLSNEDGANANISKVYIDEYKGNIPEKAQTTLFKLFTDESLKGMKTTTHFHTHLTNIGKSRTDIERPSGTTGQGGDLGFRDNNKQYFRNFLILTRTATYPPKVMHVKYTNWKK